MSSSSQRMLAFAIAIALSYLLPSISARALWLPEEFDPNAGRSVFRRQDTSTCPSDANLYQCPTDFPPNFCCSPGTRCLHINTTNSSITAAICCPKGQHCETINPISCDQAFQDATNSPNSQLHSIPPKQLDVCGVGCCPMGFTCNENDQCVAQVPLSANLSSASPTALPGSEPTSAPSKSNSHSSEGSISKDPSNVSFNGTSFAAGLVPGLAIGAILAALILLCCMRKKKDRHSHRRSNNSYYHEKSRDTLTDLSTLQSHPTMHGRSISEPTVDPSTIGVTRTDFLRGSPIRTVDLNNNIRGDDNNSPTEGPAPKTPTHRTPRIKALFSRSPFMNQQPPTSPPITQPPLPAHTKRGTISFQISPIRALKKQKSMHSLRRQMSEHRTESTETIQVLMSPDEEPSYKAGPTGSWLPPPTTISTPITAKGPTVPQQAKRVPYASSSRYPSELPQQQFRIPSPPPPMPNHHIATSSGGAGAGGGGGGPSFLDSPYTPTKTYGKSGGLAVPGSSPDTRRDTTFSTLMEKAGLRKSELIMGTRRKG